MEPDLGTVEALNMNLENPENLNLANPENLANQN